MTHPEPPEQADDLTNEQLEQIAYVLWEHGAGEELRARVTAELRGEQPPEWAVDPDEKVTILDTNRRYVCLMCQDLSEGKVGPRFDTEREALIHLRHQHGDVNDGRMNLAINVGEWAGE